MALRYVGSWTAALRDAQGRRLTELIWGDPVHVLDASTDPVKARARGREGLVPAAALTDRGLLEVYVIDVGQGDGVLLCTPDGRWHLIDAGVANRDQMTRKGTANFLVWKFLRDLRRDRVDLATVIVTHPDYDHFGGLLDLLGGRLFDGRTFRIEVDRLYHCGLGRFREAPKLGRTVDAIAAVPPGAPPALRRRDAFVTELLDDAPTFENPGRPFEPRFAGHAPLVARVPRQVRRLTHLDRHLPGYEPGAGECTIHVLGPVLESLGPAGVGLRVLGSESVTRNGHSVVLRVDYGAARLLLTGDLNAASQRLLLAYHGPETFAADVMKACHHGSEDVSLDFLRAVKARVTIASSGDSEDYSHPRPLVLGASGRYGRESRGPRGELIPPLVYSTELARSTALAYAASVRVALDGEAPQPPRVVDAGRTEVRAREGGAYRPLASTPISTDLVYGLVNVRTDGTHVLCATMAESGADFDVKVFRAGADV